MKGEVVSASDSAEGVKRTHEKKNDWFLVNPYLITGIVGASFCFVWFFSILLTPRFLFIDSFTAETAEFSHIVFVLGILFGYFIIWRFSALLQTRRAILIVVALICSTANSWGWGYFDIGLIEASVFAAASGIGITAMMVLWAEFLCSLLKSQVRTAVAASMALAFVWVLGVIVIDAAIIPLVIAGYALLSAVIYAFLKRNFSLMDTMPQVLAKESDRRLTITWKSLVLTIMGSLAQGFALYWLITPSVHTPIVRALIGGFALVVFLLLFIDSFRSFLLKESIIRRLMLPVLAACILTLFFLPSRFWVWPCLLAFLFSLMPYASAIFATCEHVVRFRLSAIRVYAWGRLVAAFGLLLGLFFGWLAFSSNIFGDNTLPVWVVVFVMMFIVVTAVLSNESYYPGDEGETKPRSPTVRIGPNGEVLFETEPDHSESQTKKYFRLKCDAIVEEYGLSKRQAEVLYLLAKGRNAKYIEQQLVVSHHTAKAHIYNIYQKTGAHSQQELIDLVENAEIGEDSKRS